MSVEEIKSKPQEMVIKLLEKRLEEAKNGNIQSIVIVGVCGDGSVFNCFDGSYYPSALIGEMRITERDLIDCCVDIRRQVAWEYTE